jgi:hypothetical protein
MFRPGFSAAKSAATEAADMDKSNKRARIVPTGVVMNPKTGAVFFRKKDWSIIPHTL